MRFFNLFSVVAAVLGILLSGMGDLKAAPGDTSGAAFFGADSQEELHRCREAAHAKARQLGGRSLCFVAFAEQDLQDDGEDGGAAAAQPLAPPRGVTTNGLIYATGWMLDETPENCHAMCAFMHAKKAFNILIVRNSPIFPVSGPAGAPLTIQQLREGLKETCCDVTGKQHFPCTDKITTPWEELGSVEAMEDPVARIAQQLALQCDVRTVILAHLSPIFFAGGKVYQTRGPDLTWLTANPLKKVRKGERAPLGPSLESLRPTGPTSSAGAAASGGAAAAATPTAAPLPARTRFLTDAQLGRITQAYVVGYASEVSSHDGRLRNSLTGSEGKTMVCTMALALPQLQNFDLTDTPLDGTERQILYGTYVSTGGMEGHFRRPEGAPELFGMPVGVSWIGAPVLAEIAGVAEPVFLGTFHGVVRDSSCDQMRIMQPPYAEVMRHDWPSYAVVEVRSPALNELTRVFRGIEESTNARMKAALEGVARQKRINLAGRAIPRRKPRSHDCQQDDASGDDADAEAEATAAATAEAVTPPAETTSEAIITERTAEARTAAAATPARPVRSAGDDALARAARSNPEAFRRALFGGQSGAKGGAKK